MKTIATPFKNKPGYYETAIREFHYGLRFPRLSIGKKGYMLENGVLKAIIPVAYQLVAKYSYTNSCFWMMKAKVAGKADLVEIPVDSCDKFFESVAEYNALIDGNVAYIPSVNAQDFITYYISSRGFKLTDSGPCYKSVEEFCGRKGDTKCFRNGSNFVLWIDALGRHFEIIDEDHVDEYGRQVYYGITEKEVMEKLRCTEVLDFDDEPSKRKSGTRTLTITIEYKEENEDTILRSIKSIDSLKIK